jgi:hypothetical protein
LAPVTMPSRTTLGGGPGAGIAAIVSTRRDCGGGGGGGRRLGENRGRSRVAGKRSSVTAQSGLPGTALDRAQASAPASAARTIDKSAATHPTVHS